MTMSSIIEQASQELKEAIRDNGVVLDEDLLKIDSVLNHRIDPDLMDRIGQALAKEYEEDKVDIVLTAEAAGNSIASNTARYLNGKGEGKIYALYAKKGEPTTMVDPIKYPMESPTKQEKTFLAAEGKYLEGKRVIIVDDFLFTGETSQTLTKITKDADVEEIVGYGFVIEKEGYGGREELEQYDKPIISLARIRNMDPETGEINFSEKMSRRRQL